MVADSVEIVTDVDLVLGSPRGRRFCVEVAATGGGRPILRGAGGRSFVAFWIAFLGSAALLESRRTR